MITTERLVRVRCEVRGCEAGADYAMKQREVLVMMRERGWSFDGRGYARCPECRDLPFPGRTRAKRESLKGER